MKLHSVALVAVALASVGCREEVRTIPTGLRGEARSNPLLAAQRTLERFDVPSTLRYGLTALPGRGDVLLTEEGSLAVEGSILDDFLTWVDEGGQAIVCLDGFDLRTGLDAFVENEDLFGGQLELLDEATMPWLFRESALLDELEIDRYPLEEAIEEAFDLEIQGRARDGVLENVSEFGVIVHADRGAGRVTVLPSGHFFNNENLGKAEHAALLLELVDDARRMSPVLEPQLVIAYADAPGLWSLLTERAPHALWGALALLVVWLWRSWPRFGPPADFEDGGLPGFQSHAAAIGQFLWKHDRGPTLLAATRKRTLARLRATVPGGDALSPGDLCRRIAEQTGHDAGDVERALFDSGPLPPDAFVAVQRTLIQLGPGA